MDDGREGERREGGTDRSSAVRGAWFSFSSSQSMSSSSHSMSAGRGGRKEGG